MDKQNVTYPYNGILLSNKKVGTSIPCNDMDESQKHAVAEKPGTKELILYYSIYKKL